MDTIGALLYNIELPELVGQYTELTYQNGVSDRIAFHS